MGVHGLSSLLSSHGLLPSSSAASSSDAPRTLDAPGPKSHIQSIPRGSTLAVDGDGLVFYLLKLAYGEHRRNVLLAGGKKSTQKGSSAAAAATSTAALIPTFLPPSTVHTTTLSYLNSLIGERGMRLTLYFDGDDQRMKSKTAKKRKMQREEEWTNLRQFCTRGVLPEGCKEAGGTKKTSRYRSSSRRSRKGGAKQQYDAQAQSAKQDEDDANAYWSSFPLGRLVIEQCRRSMEHYATEIAPGKISFMDCTGEADVEVARASANDLTGRTYAVGQDSDYCIYGYTDDIVSKNKGRGDDAGVKEGDIQYFATSSFQSSAPDASSLPTPFFGGAAAATTTTGSAYNAAVNEGTLHLSDDEEDIAPTPTGGPVKYVPLNLLDFNVPNKLRGVVLQRSEVAMSLGLPHSESIIDLSIVLGNDYTGPYIRHENSAERQRYRKSLFWERDTDRNGNDEYVCGGWGHVAELNWSDLSGVVDFVADKIEHGFRVRSDIAELDLAIAFSRDLYGFRDVSSFPIDASTVDDGDEEDEDEEEVLTTLDEHKSTPSLPASLDLNLATMGKANMPIHDAVLLPLSMYMSESSFCVGRENDVVVEQKHTDAFRVVTEVLSSDLKDIRAPKRIQWNDVRVLYILERCILTAISDEAGDERGHFLPYEILDPSSFLYAVESLSFDDFPLDNEVVGKNERAFLEDATSLHPSTAGTLDTQKPKPKQQPLPIDDHEHDILEAVKTQRVTIIHGETGCGKSSRVPVMLLRSPPPEPTAKAREVKMFVTQPRRIAAKSLTERVRDCEPDLRNKIALRMGHGLREYECMDTKAWFVTTGYCVRLLANHPEFFDSHTHLLVDEVHERSVDTDILCLLCRRLLVSHPTIRLVLMSATMAASLYSSYFGVPEPPIHVGARRFPIKEYFVEDLAKALKLPQKDAKRAMEVFNECEAKKCKSAPNRSHMDKLFQLAKQITLSVGSHGSAVLIFVTGMNDIEALCDLIENINVPGIVYTCLPIHSDVPFEEQMAAFDPPGEGEVKVVIATNAAESSVTLPDVDHVICLGLCKQIVYNEASHRQMLQPCWISKASATQRAGRTGRVRKGNVYRLYSRNAFNKYMAPYDAGEMVRIPLDSVILSLRDMLKEEVTPILLDCLEPPDVSNIDRSFESLHKANFISEPSDDCDITSLGALVVALGIDLTLGALVGLGIQFGVAAEAIEMAAILSFPKTPWAITSPMYHETKEFNEITSKTFISRCQFDAGLYSEPMGIMNMLWEFKQTKGKGEFCRRHCVSYTRLRHLSGTVESLRRRVAERLNVPVDFLELNEAPRLAPHAKATILRILQVWLFHDTMIELARKEAIQSHDGSFSIEISGPSIEARHLRQVLNSERHPFGIQQRVKTIHAGHFNAADAYLADTLEYFRNFEYRFISYMLENNIDIAFYYSGSSIHLFIPREIYEKSEGLQRAISVAGVFNEAPVPVDYIEVSTGNKRGRRGRACAAWTLHPRSGDPDLIGFTNRLLRFSSRLKKGKAKEFKKSFDKTILNADPDIMNSFLSCTVSEVGKKAALKVSFTITTGGSCKEISAVDLGDLFVAPDLSYGATSHESPQVLKFFASKSRVASMALDSSVDSGQRPLLDDIPEGARLVTVLASERRRDNFVRFEGDEGRPALDISLPRDLGINSGRWRRRDSHGMVYVPVNSVPASAIPTGQSTDLFAVCANTLELNGGAIRADGITLLPSGRLFFALALLSFGINPRTLEPVQLDLASSEEEKKDSDSIEGLYVELVPWMCKNGPELTEERFMWITDRIDSALEFNKACMVLGEELVCHADAVRRLCELFDTVDGYRVSVWDDLGVNPFVPTEESKDLLLQPATTVSSRASSRANSRARIRPLRGETKAPAVALPAAPASKHDTPGKKQYRRYDCISCSNRFSKFSKCLAHMRGCCPNMLTEQNTQPDYCLVFVNDPRIHIPMTPAHASNADETQWDNALTSLYEEMDTGLQISDNEPAANGNETEEHYRCLSCGEKKPSWRQIKKHMKSCCPGQLSGLPHSIVKQRCAVGDVAAAGARRREQQEEARRSKKNCAYACIGCGKTWRKSGICLAHMKDCCPEMLEGRDINLLSEASRVNIL